MTQGTIVLANLRRRLRRTILTVLGLATAIFLFVTLRTFLRTLQTVGDVGSETRLVVSNKLGIIFDMPLAYRARLSTVDGVNSVSYATWFGAVYPAQPKSFFANFAIDSEEYLKQYPEMIISPNQIKTYITDHTNTLINVRLMEHFD